MNLEITRDGKIYKDGKLTKTYIRSKTAPYLCISIGKKLFSVHRLVAEKYINNPNNFPDVNHINGNKLDNRVENLEWVTKSQNAIHRYKVLNKKHNSDYLRVLNDEDVKYIRNNYKPRFYTMKSLSEKFKVSQSTIHRIIHQKLDY